MRSVTLTVAAHHAQLSRLFKPPDQMLEEDALDQTALMVFLEEMEYVTNAKLAKNSTNLQLLVLLQTVTPDQSSSPMEVASNV